MIDENTIKAPEIVVYSTKTCPYCVIAKRYLNERGVKYTDYDVGADQNKAFEMLTKSGQMGVPVLDINGSVIIGFDRMAIDRALGGSAKPQNSKNENSRC
ncbi:MAG: glutathione S-transferase N-terminal domain-containing protein [Candidatus Micrarchaeota archaeon]|nr:glutathione S-transferase N-terminal domain-containing protein [Candidatus Micrarchaeota archaeon]